MKYTEEDWEMEALKDEIYVIERRKRMEAEWQQWEEANKKAPAKITINIPKGETRRKFTKRSRKVLSKGHKT